ncbi:MULTISPECIES: hypothetical protein [Caballeronia]|uniref:hypothetical protein n=1 Tax=Caballeronia TaxID=1827195 RepID=UPI00025BB138|nr:MULTISPECIES: hypothetical protein [Caballeronia]EKS73173.1 hypothetical protein BURK_001860 [Burkholderia sp. SJ98]MCG7402908.1 hypothetical protein [Caballeronia zhejiangensis]
MAGFVDSDAFDWLAIVAAGVERVRRAGPCLADRLAIFSTRVARAGRADSCFTTRASDAGMR